MASPTGWLVALRAVCFVRPMVATPTMGRDHATSGGEVRFSSSDDSESRPTPELRGGEAVVSPSDLMSSSRSRSSVRLRMECAPPRLVVHRRWTRAQARESQEPSRGAKPAHNHQHGAKRKTNRTRRRPGWAIPQFFGPPSRLWLSLFRADRFLHGDPFRAVNGLLPSFRAGHSAKQPGQPAAAQRVDR